MTRALPRFRAPLVSEILYAERGPRFTSPAGVTLRPLKEGEINDEPVLVCAGRCNRPTIHRRQGFAERFTGISICLTCDTERRW